MGDRDRTRHRLKAGCCTQGARTPVEGRSIADLPQPVRNALRTALKDERDAHATYQAILDRFGDVRPFSNIVHAEARHIAALLDLYKRYGIAVRDAPGEPHPAAASKDLRTLCQIALDAEIENTRLYDEALLPTVADYPDIAAVLQRLRDASWNNHRPAFERCIHRRS